jgi:peptidyl-tRNA hydrolase
LKPYVLNRLPPGEQAELDGAIDRAVEAADHWRDHPVEQTMNLFNG